MRCVNNAPLSPLTGVCGWETYDEQLLMMKCVRQVRPNTNIVEIGSENGMSASIWRKYADESVHIFCIEPNKEAAYQENLTGTGLDWKVYPIQKYSQDVSWEDEAEKIGVVSDIDLLFVDGDHSYNGAKTDLMRFTPYLRKECYVLIHDVAWETNKHPHEIHLDVRRAVDDWLSTKIGQQFKFVEAADSLVVFKRKESTLA